MNLLTMNMLILTVLAIVLTQTLVFIYTAHVMKNDNFYKAEMTYFKAYFLFVIGAYFFTAYLVTHNILMFFNESDIAYYIAGVLLLLAIVEKARSSLNILMIMCCIFALALMNLYYADHTVLIATRVFFSFIIYGLLVFTAFQKGYSEKNEGYYILSAAFAIQIVAACILGYELFHHDEVLAQTTTVVGNTIGYLLVGIGFMSKILIGEHNKMLNLALYDTLTGLNNRRGLDHLLQGLIPLMEREEKEVSVVAADIDFFKKINDTYGHDGGDAVLKEFGKHLDAFKRESDICCRFGGEEFVVVLPNTGKDEAKILVERLRASIEQLQIPFEKTIITLTASFGISTERGRITFDEMLKQADQALYHSKKMGRNCLYHSVELDPS